MVKVVVNDNKGLVQYGGQTGLEINNTVTGESQAKGMEFVKYGAVQSLNAANDYDDEITLPAGATITDIGIQFLTICKTANVGASDKLAVKVGYSAGGTDLINDIEILIQNKTAVAGSGQSVALANLAESSATALTIPAAALLRDAAGAARSIHTRFVVETRALATAGTARFYIKYIIT